MASFPGFADIFYFDGVECLVLMNEQINLFCVFVVFRFGEALSAA